MGDEVHLERGVEETVTAAEDGGGFTLEVPGEADAGSEVITVGGVALSQSVVLFRGDAVVFVTETKVEGEGAGDAVVVLEIPAEFAVALVDAADADGAGVGEWGAGEEGPDGGEDHRAVEVTVAGRVVLNDAGDDAGLEDMLAERVTEIVGEGVVVSAGFGGRNEGAEAG